MAEFASVHKQEIINALNISVENLRQGIDTHRCLVAAILESQVDDRRLQPLLDFCPKRSREIKLENAIKTAIEIIEESRKAFKSKKLETLRKELTRVLIDAD